MRGRLTKWLPQNCNRNTASTASITASNQWPGLQKLEFHSRTGNEYELPALERLTNSATQDNGFTALSASNSAPDLAWELQEIGDQQPQLPRLDMEDPTTQPNRFGADPLWPVADEAALGPLTSIYIPMTLQALKPAADHDGSSNQAAASGTATLQGLQTRQASPASAASGSRFSAADLVPMLISKLFIKQQKKASPGTLNKKSGVAAIDLAAAAVDDEHLQHIQATINFDPKASFGDVVAAYEQAAASKKDTTGTADAALLPLEPKDLRGQPCDYQRLAQTKFLQGACRIVLRSFQAYFRGFHEKVQQHQDIEWIIMVDNSGSMMSKKTQVSFPCITFCDCHLVVCAAMCCFATMHPSAIDWSLDMCRLQRQLS